MKKVLLVLALLALALPAMANTVPISFSGHNQGVAFSFTDALGNTFNVNNAPITSVQIGATSYGVTNGVLNLQSGADLGSATLAGTTYVSFDAGGNLTIVGEVAGKGINTVQTLLQGTFANGSATFNPGSVGNGGNFGGSLIVSFLNSALGMMPVNTAADSQTNINITLAAPGTFQGTVNDSTISLQASVPEPGTLALFGSGLIGIAGMLRRKLSL